MVLRRKFPDPVIQSTVILVGPPPSGAASKANALVSRRDFVYDLVSRGHKIVDLIQVAISCIRRVINTSFVTSAVLHHVSRPSRRN